MKEEVEKNKAFQRIDVAFMYFIIKASDSQQGCFLSVDYTIRVFMLYWDARKTPGFRVSVPRTPAPRSRVFEVSPRPSWSLKTGIVFDM